MTSPTDCVGVLGVRPERGRLIDPSDDRLPDSHPVVVLSYDYWRNVLAGAEDVLNKTVLLNNHPMTVIGVAPASFRGLDLGGTPAVWVPAMTDARVDCRNRTARRPDVRRRGREIIDSRLPSFEGMI